MLNCGYRYQEHLGDEASGVEICRYLAHQYRHSTMRTWAGRVRDGDVRVDGHVVEQSYTLRRGEVLTWDRPAWREPDAPSSFAVLYRDDEVLAVAKPRGMPMMPGGGFLERTLLRRVQALAPEAAPLHRLGRGTSGVTLFSRSKRARRGLTESWNEGRVERRYRGLVEGMFPRGETLINQPIGPAPHPLLGEVFAASADGKRAVSHVTLLEQRDETSLVEIAIETGRTHQIRIHLAACGHPLEGDPLYPKGGVPDPATRVLPGALGFWLHAESVRFPHPLSGELVSLRCQPPPVLRRTER